MTTNKITDTDELAGLTVTDLPPCMLLVLDVSRTGGQTYTREDETIEKRADGSTFTTWTTKKLTQDEDEFAAATSLQNKCKREGSKLGRHMTTSNIAVNKSKKRELKAFVLEWREKIAEFNANSKHTKINLNSMIFNIKGDNIQSLEVVLEDLRNCLGEMEEAYKSLEPMAIRDVVAKMAGFTDLLPEKVGNIVQGAIEEAKTRANKISRNEKKLSRIERKIAEELNGGDLDEELAALSKERLTATIKTRVTSLRKLADEKEGAIAALELAKKTINETPIKLARFAVRRPGVQKVGSDRSADLYGAQAAARFAAR